jgi:O-antigen ligase
LSSEQQLLWQGPQPLLLRKRSVAKPAKGLPLLLLCGVGVLVAVLTYSFDTGQYAPLFFLGASAVAVSIVFGVFYARAHPEWLIFAIAALYITLPVSLFSDRLRGFIHYGLLAALCLPLLPALFRSEFLRQGSFRLYVYYFAFAFLTVFYSLAPAFSLGRLAGAVLGFTAVVTCASQIENGTQARTLIEQFALACFIAVAVTALSAIVMPHAITWELPGDSFDANYLAALNAQGIVIPGVPRFRGIYGNANDVGGLMLITVAPILACWSSASRRRKWLFAIFAAIAIVSAFMADSRSPFVALGVGGMLYLIWRFGWRGLLVVGAVAAGAVGFLLLEHDVSYATRGDVGSLTGRTDIWAYAIGRIREHPFIGYGYEVSGAIFANRYFPIWYGPWDEGPHSSLHNGYIAHAVGLGLPVTALWLFIIIRPWWFIFRHKRDPWGLKPFVLLVVIPAMVLNLTEASLDDFNGALGILFGLVWAIGERYRLEALRQSGQARREAFATATHAAQALWFKPASDGYWAMRRFGR